MTTTCLGWTAALLLLAAAPIIAPAAYAEKPKAHVVEVRQSSDGVLVYLSLTADQESRVTLIDASLIDADGQILKLSRHSGIHVDAPGSCRSGTAFPGHAALPITLGFEGVGSGPFSLLLQLEGLAEAGTCRPYDVYLGDLRPR